MQRSYDPYEDSDSSYDSNEDFNEDGFDNNLEEMDYYDDINPDPQAHRTYSVHSVRSDLSDRSDRSDRNTPYTPYRENKLIIEAIRIVLFSIAIVVCMYSLFIRYSNKDSNLQEYYEADTRANAYLVLSIVLIFTGYMLKYLF